MNVNVLEPFVIDRVALRLVTGHLLPPGLWLTRIMLRGWIKVKNGDVVCWERVCCPGYVARELSGMFAACSGGGGCDGLLFCGVRS